MGGLKDDRVCNVKVEDINNYVYKIEDGEKLEIATILEQLVVSVMLGKYLVIPTVIQFYGRH